MILRISVPRPPSKEEATAMEKMKSVLPWLERLANLVSLAEQSTSLEELKLFIDALEECEDAFIAEHPDWNPIWRCREAIRLRKGDWARVYDRARELGVDI